MNSIKKKTLWVIGSLVLSALLFTMAPAQATAASPIKISLVADKTTYGPDDPIKMQVTAFNDPTDIIEDVISREAWLYQNFHLMITIIDPDGVPRKNLFAMIQPEPGPPYRYKGRDAVRVEIIPPDGKSIIAIDDAHAYYNLNKYGWYTAEVLAPLETFSAYVTGPTGALFSYLDDPGRKGFNPVASNKIRFEIVPPEPVVTSSIHVYVNLLKIGQGTKPGATKDPLKGAEVQLIRKSKIPTIYDPINWKVYSEIWGKVDPEFSGLTNGKGIVKFPGVEKDDYLVLAQHHQFSDFKHMGSPVSADDPRWLTIIEKHLMVMLKADQKKVPGKTKRLKGSDLLITEPEYIVWDSSQETYPFVFETIGDWGITTSVTPPEGFVADNESLSADVTNEMEAVQFTITDVGSRWEETKVTYRIKHKGTTKKIKSKIGIKLSKKLANKKGLGRYGHTPTPGPFKGGKKVVSK